MRYASQNVPRVSFVVVNKNSKLDKGTNAEWWMADGGWWCVSLSFEMNV